MSKESIQNPQPKIQNLNRRHLLGLSSWGAEEIQLVLQTARRFREVLERPIPQVPTLRGTTVATLFFEPSTRTKLSFQLAASRLSASTVSFSKAARRCRRAKPSKTPRRTLRR